LVKFRITVLVSFTTALGYFLASTKLGFAFVYPVLGIFLLACSAAALNQYQEVKTDLMMERTRNRPIPSGKISRNNVLIISAILLLAGTSILFIKTNFGTLFTGLLTFYWYNAVYTPLKKKTALAIIPGSLVGALPPLAGWLAAGGNLLDS
jgi:protoheme IX farnesyltransferase